MTAIIFLHYFIVNIFGLGIVPRNVKYGGLNYFSVEYKDLNERYYIGYSAYIDTEGNTTDLFNVSAKCKYIVYLKSICMLWGLRKTISFGIDNY